MNGSAEAYYAPDSLHVIAQVQDSDAQRAAESKSDGFLTYTFTDQGEEIQRVNDRGRDACSYYFPDQTRLVWTSTRDHMDLPLGNWSDEGDYPTGAELYVSDLARRHQDAVLAQRGRRIYGRSLHLRDGHLVAQPRPAAGLARSSCAGVAAPCICTLGDATRPITLSPRPARKVDHFCPGLLRRAGDRAIAIAIAASAAT